MDSVFGYAGQAELRPMIEEGESGEESLQFLGESEEIGMDEIEELDLSGNVNSNVPLSSDDYESI
jgi:hypothetical protein